MTRRDPILLAWGGGLLLAVLVYVVGPERFLFRLLDNMHLIAWQIGELVDQLSLLTLDAVRALAIGLYATFVGLGLAVLRRGGRARGALFWVSLFFVLLAGGMLDGGPSSGRWAVAMLLAGAAALMMTMRLRLTGTAAVKH